MKKICVFCGSASGKNSKYVGLANELGDKLVQKDMGLVYGGASIGVMGAVADSVLKKDGAVWGVIPQAIIDLEVGHENLTELKIVGSMHERKKQMYDLSDAFVAIPGGMGTLDELCEIITWAQLKFHHKPCYVLNVDGFFDHLMEHFRYINTEGFLSDEHLALVKEVKSLDELFSDFELSIK